MSQEQNKKELVIGTIKCGSDNYLSAKDLVYAITRMLEETNNPSVREAVIYIRNEIEGLM